MLRRCWVSCSCHPLFDCWGSELLRLLRKTRDRCPPDWLFRRAWLRRCRRSCTPSPLLAQMLQKESAHWKTQSMRRLVGSTACCEWLEPLCPASTMSSLQLPCLRLSSWIKTWFAKQKTLKRLRSLKGWSRPLRSSHRVGRRALRVGPPLSTLSSTSWRSMRTT